MPRNTLSDAQIQANRAALQSGLQDIFLKPLFRLDQAFGQSPEKNPLYGGYNPDATPLQRAKVGQPMILGGKLGYKAADGTFQLRGDMDAPEDNLTYSPVYKGGRYVDTDADQVVIAPAVDRKELERQSVRADYDKIRADKNLTTKVKEAKGLEMWRQANPELAKKLDAKRFGDRVVQENGMRTPGYNPLMQSTFGYQAQPEIRQPLEGQEIIEAVNANKANEMAERFTAPEGAEQPAFVVDPAATTYPDAKKKLLNRAILKQLQNEAFQADAPKIL